MLLIAPLFDLGVELKKKLDNIIMMLRTQLKKVSILMHPKIVLLVAPLFETWVKISTKCHLLKKITLEGSREVGNYVSYGNTSSTFCLGKPK
jgi:hypothetical protein